MDKTKIAPGRGSQAVEPVARPAPPTRGAKISATTTLMGMPSVAASSSLATKAYSRVVGDSRVTAPGLADRKASAQALVEQCERALQTEKDTTRRARLHTEIARLSEVVLDDLEAAVRNYQKAHSLDVRFEPAIAGLLRVRARQGQWEATVGLFDQQVELTAAPADKAALLFCKAVVLEERLDRRSDARSDYEKALTFVPNQVALLSAVARCARRDQDWKTLDGLLAGLSQLHGEDVALSAAHLAERARVAEQYRKQTGEAAQFYQKALSTDPMATAAIYALERLQGIHKQPRAHVELLNQKASLIDDAPSRASILSAAGAILAETLNEPAEAAQLYEFAWSAQPDNLDFLRTLEELYRRAGDFDGVVRVLERLIERPQAGDEVVPLCLRVAEVLHRRLDRQEDAVEYLERAREMQPALADCVTPLCAYYEQQESWGALVQVLVEEEAACEDPLRRSVIHCRVARVCEYRLSSPDDAAHHYQAALGLTPNDEAAFRNLARLFEEARRYEELVELLQRKAETEKDRAVAQVHLFKVGQVLENLLRAPARAIPVYRQILEDEEGHLGALYALQRAAEGAGEHLVLVDALIEEANVRATPVEKVPLLHRAGTVCEESLGQSQRALQLFGDVLKISAQYAPTLDALVALHEAEGRHAELLKTLTLKLNGIKEPKARSRHLHRMGRLCEEHLRQDEKALTYFKKASEADGHNEEVALAIERCLRRLERYDELAAYLSERTKRIDAAELRAQVQLRLGEVFEMRLAKLPSAVSAYEAALKDAPALIQAQDALIRVLELRGDHGKTAAALEKRVEGNSDSAVRLWARLRRAEILENTAKKTDEPIAGYKLALEEDPRQVEALTALARLYEQNDDDHRLTRALRLHATSLKAEENQAGVMRELLRLGEKGLDPSKPDETATDRAAGQLPDLSAALLERYSGDRSALRYAELMAIADRNEEQLAAVDSHLVRIPDQPQLSSAHRTRLGEFLEPRSPVQALEQHRPALKEDPENVGSARGITRIAEEVREADLLLEAAELEARVVRDVARAASLYVLAAQVLGAGGDSERAVESLRQGLAVNPDSTLAAQALHEMLSVRSEFDSLVTILTTAAQASTTAEARAEHWIAVAKIYADELDDVPAAVAALRRLDKDGIKNLPATLELAELLVRDRQWNPAVAQLKKAAAFKPEAHVLAAVRLRLAEIYQEKLGKTADATTELRAILTVEPQHVAALRRLLAIQMKEKSKGAVETAQTLSEVSDGPERAEALLAMGQLLVREKKPSEALQPFAAAIALVGLEPPDAAQGMRKILESAKSDPANWAGYAKALADFTASSQPNDHQARVFAELGRVIGERQKDASAAAKTLKQGLLKNGESTELRRELIRWLREAKQYQDALPELLTLQKAEPLRGETWADLVEVYDALGMNAESHMATGPLVLLGKATQLQNSTWKNREPQAAMLGPGVFNADALSQSLVQGMSLDAVGLLEQMANLLPKVFPPKLSDYGTSARAKLGPKDPHPCRAVINRLCHCFGGGLELDIYPSETAQRIRLLLTDPVGIVLPPEAADLSELEQAFYLGAFVASAARGSHAVEALNEEDLALALGAATRIVSPEADVTGVNMRRLGPVTKKLNKALPWLSKGRFEDAAKRYAAAPVVDVNLFRKQMQRSSFRASMIIADDVSPLAKLEKSAALLCGVEANDVTPLIADLLGYWANPSSVSLRRQIGLLSG